MGYLVTLYSVYGSAFFLLGFTILLYPKEGSRFSFASRIWLIGVFGIVHGLNEWMDMLQLLQGPGDPLRLRWVGLITLTGSFLFLLCFALSLAAEKRKNRRFLSAVPVFLVLLWGGLTVSTGPTVVSGNILGRYLLGLPATWWTSYALLVLAADIQNEANRTVTAHLKLGAVAFFLYGLASGLVVPRGDFFPASLVHEDLFWQHVKIPVQVFRTLLAIIITYSLVQVLSLFRSELAAVMHRRREELETQVRDRTLTLHQTLEQLQEEVRDRKRAEEALHKALSRVEEEMSKSEAIIASVGCGLCIYDLDFVIRHQNESHQRYMGNHVGEYCYKAFQGRESVCDDCPVERSLRDGRTHRSERMIETDEGEIHFEVTASPLRNSNGRIVGSAELMTDVTERKRMESDLLKTEKLKSLGVLAGGLAHDFNNLLTGILGNIDLARFYTEPQDQIHRRLTEAETTAYRARDLVRQLLTFSKGGVPIRKKVCLQTLLTDSCSLALAGSRVKCEVSAPADLWPVFADEEQVAQVFHNLLINASQTMPKGGSIRIQGRNLRLPDEAALLPLKPGPYVQVSVQDEGEGIPREIQEKIFDPYFTTRETGSGLGLTTAYSIVQKHNGHLTFESAAEGTTFFVYLPALLEETASQAETRKTALQGAGKILIMDDEEAVRTVAGEMLKSLGYEVAFADTGEKTIELFSEARQRGTPFDAILMDLTIPGGLGGKETLQRLREIDPTVRGIASSGYSNDSVLANFETYGFKGALSKPYTIDDLGRIVGKVVTDPL